MPVDTLIGLSVLQRECLSHLLDQDAFLLCLQIPESVLSISQLQILYNSNSSLSNPSLISGERALQIKYSLKYFCSIGLWRRVRDLNPGYPKGYNGFRDRPDQPLRQLSLYISFILKKIF